MNSTILKHLIKESLEELLLEYGVIQKNNKYRVADLAARYNKQTRTITRWVGQKLPEPLYDAAGMYWLKETIEAWDLRLLSTKGYISSR